MKQYEHTWKDDTYASPGLPLALMLNEMGKEGWELCAVSIFNSFGRYFFKRELPPPPSKPLSN